MDDSKECTFYDVGCWLGWLVDGLESIVLWLLEMLLNAFAAVLEAIPLPGWLENSTSFGALPDGILYYTTMFQVPFGLSVVASAYTIRFLIRRIPIIG